MPSTATEQVSTRLPSKNATANALVALEALHLLAVKRGEHDIAETAAMGIEVIRGYTRYRRSHGDWGQE